MLFVDGSERCQNVPRMCETTLGVCTLTCHCRWLFEARMDQAQASEGVGVLDRGNSGAYSCVGWCQHQHCLCPRVGAWPF
jgi:hypothetical protein